MRTIDKILANVVLAILLTSCYLLLPATLIAAFTLSGLETSYIYLIGLLRAWYRGVAFKCLHVVIIPTVMVAMTAICWIKSRRIDIANLLSPRTNIHRLKAVWDSMVDLTVLPINQAFSSRIFVRADNALSWFKHNYNSGTALEPENNMQTQRLAEDPVSEELIVREEVPNQEPEVVQEPPVEEPDIVHVPTRVRTQEEQRLHRCIEDLEVLEAEGLPETMTTEEAILLMMTRRAAANGRGVVCYSLSEKLGPYGRDHQPEIHQHQILRPHNRYYGLHTSRGNVFRPDEPDCAICFCPLVHGEAMVTHDTCRRTFHEVCYNESLRRRENCPFDRGLFFNRSAAHRDPTPVIIPGSSGMQQPFGIYLTPSPDVRDAMAQRLQARVQPPQPQAQAVAQLAVQPNLNHTNRPQTVGRAPLLDRRPVVDPVPTSGRTEQPAANGYALPQPRDTQPAPVRRRETQAQQSQRLLTQRGRPDPFRQVRPTNSGPAGAHDQPLPTGQQAQRPGNDTTQANIPRNNGRSATHRRQSNLSRARTDARRTWR